MPKSMTYAPRPWKVFHSTAQSGRTQIRDANEQPICEIFGDSELEALTVARFIVKKVNGRETP